MLAMRGLEQAHGARNADRFSPQHGIVEVERFAILQEAIGFGGGRRRLAPVVGNEPLRARIVHQKKPAAADAR